MNEKTKDYLRIALNYEEVKEPKDILSTLEKCQTEVERNWRISPLVFKLAMLNNLEKKTQIKEIEKNAKQGIVRQLALEQQLRKTLNLLTDNKLEVILLKGTAYSNFLYSKDAPRLANDIDLLVQSKDFELAKKIITESMCVIEKRRTFSKDEKEDFEPVNKVYGYNIDLHNSLCLPFLFNINYQELWDKSDKASYYSFDRNEYIKIMSTEYLICHIAIHSAINVNFMNYSLIDLHQIDKKNLLKIEKVKTLAKEIEASIPLYFLFSAMYEITNDKKYLKAYKSIKTKVPKLAKMALKLKKFFPDNENKKFKDRLYQLFCFYAFSENKTRTTINLMRSLANTIYKIIFLR